VGSSGGPGRLSKEKDSGSAVYGYVLVSNYSFYLFVFFFGGLLVILEEPLSRMM